MADYHKVRGALDAHFLTWSDIEGRIGGEWRCTCGRKFGFSGTAVSHQAAMVTKALNPPISEAEWHQEWLASRNDR